ncbi:hypothetical protein ACSBR1_029657 [Camellia fascicularis]
MKLRSCTHLHFIKAIKAGLVESICNVNSCGRPALVFKTLKDIYESEDAKKLNSFSTLQSQDTADMVFECDTDKTESPCLVVVERKTKKRDINSDELNYNSDDDEEDSDSDDLLFVKMTLQQLKERCKTKKRKVLHSTCLTRNQYYTDWQPEEDECDLEEPISIWKSKLPNNLKGKRKRAKKCASSSQTAVSVKSDQILSAEDSLQSSGYSPSPIHIKAEVSETDYTECRNMICVADDLSIGCSELVGLSGKVSGEISDAVKIESGSGKQISLAEECQSCVVNEVSYVFLDPIEPTCVLPSIGGETMEVDNLKKTFQLSPVLPTSEDKEGFIEHPHLEESSPETIFPVMHQSSDMSNNSPNCSSVHEISRQTSAISGVQVPEMAMDNSLFCMELYSAGDPCKFENDINENFPLNLENDSRSSPLSNCSSSWNLNPCLSPEIVLVSVEGDLPATEKPPVTSVSTDAVRSSLNPDEIPVAFEDGSTIIEEKQSPRSAPDDAESNSTNRNHHFDGAHELSVPEMKNYHHLEKMHPPERLLSTRKAISPTSQEKLCQAMKGVELHEDLDHYNCKEKLQLGKEAENSASPVGLYTEGAKVNVNLEGLGDVSRAKGTTSPQKITKKLKNDRKGSPPNGIRKGPHLSRSPPHVSTRATSIQNCSESAIAFSERQMHGIERLAMKLMQELKSMKDIVEGNLHSEASPSTLLKYDVDQVKTAIKSATKVEETTKKWLSMMTRDCNRFCKLVRLNEKDDIASGNGIHKERRKITFADEAGGVLCHVKFFEDSVASPDSKS